ncbi:hypothetical protein BOX15_Mlig004134g2 [Macrostomum lignano]|uniref:Uncharacterized protein n=1 Tax=Macrostomum lignano TaxID=282301 RepID=A0A267DH15_9PLAT|nr:hypothetical protein BOX15_Mlig004134g2 [Macrostomum lignano]
MSEPTDESMTGAEAASTKPDETTSATAAAAAATAGQKRKADSNKDSDGETKTQASQNGDSATPAKRMKLLLTSSSPRPPTDRAFLELLEPSDADSEQLAGLKARLSDFSADAVRLIARPDAFVRFLAAGSDRLECCLADCLAEESDAASAVAEAAVDLLSACFSRLLRLYVRHLPVQRLDAANPRMPSLRQVGDALAEVNRLASGFGFQLAESAAQLAGNLASLAEQLPPQQLFSSICQTADWSSEAGLSQPMLSQLVRLTEQKLELPTFPTVQLPFNVVAVVRDAIAACLLTDLDADAGKADAEGKDDVGDNNESVWRLDQAIDRIRSALDNLPRELAKQRAAAVAAAAAAAPAEAEKSSMAEGEAEADNSAADNAETEAVKPDPEAEASAKAAAEAEAAAKAAAIAYARPALAAALIECLVILHLTPHPRRQIASAASIRRRLDDARALAEAFNSAEQLRPALDAIAECLLEPLTPQPKPDPLARWLLNDPDDSLPLPPDDQLPKVDSEELLKYRGQPPVAWARHGRAAISRLVAELVSSSANADAASASKLRRQIDDMLARCRGTVEWPLGVACVNSAVELGVLGGAGCSGGNVSPTKTRRRGAAAKSAAAAAGASSWPSESALRQQLLTAGSGSSGLLDEANLRRVCLAAVSGQKPSPPAYTVRLDAEIVADATPPEASLTSAAFADCRIDWRLGQRYSLLEFSVHRPPPPPPPPPTLPISSTKSSTAEDLPKSKPAAGDGNNGKARRNADSLNPDEASLIGALDMWASRFAFNGWNAFSANLLSQAVVEFLTDSRDGANNSADESGGVTVLRTGLNQFWSGVIERIVSDRRSKLSVPYLRSVFTALEQLRTVASEIALEPSLETSLKNIALVTSWTEASFDKHCRRVGIFRDFKRDYLTALLRCHREPLELRPSHVAAITEKHVAAYHSIRRLLDALFHCRDWFAFVSSGGGGYEALVRRAPRDALSCQLVCTALMEALFWYRLRLHLGQPGELYRFSQAEAGLRADGLRRFAKAIGCKVLMRGDWLEPVIVELLTDCSE